MSTETNPANTSPENTSPDKLSIVIHAGDFEAIHYALVMASAAAAINRPVTLFFTMKACLVLARPFAWHRLPTRQEGVSAKAMDKGFKEKGIAGFDELVQACSAMGVCFMVCEMGLRAEGMEGQPLRDDLKIETGGVVTFLNDASKDGAMLFI